MDRARSALSRFRPAVRRWFDESFAAPTPAQALAWPSIQEGRSTLLLAPTGSGKTLAAFLAGLDRVMFEPEPTKSERLRLLYVSPLKALGVDIERNLRSPIAGIAALSEREGLPYRTPAVSVRSGDTPAAERARFARSPSDILITTPESLYLLLTSEARALLASVETVIVDEIHSLVTGKRGAHLFLSLERLEALRTSARPLQRIGLSATQRPLDEVARLLGGGRVEHGTWMPRPVTVVDAGARKELVLEVEVPVEDMARLNDREPGTGSAAADPQRGSIWPAIHPRLVELVRGHRSTMIFVNSRRLAERLAAALNELAGEELALAHHGSIARERRLEIEDRLKRGELPAIVATSSLELGIDMGAVDLVIQIEAPPSVASGLQRIGRSGHGVGQASTGVIFPKHRGDLLPCAAVTTRMLAGEVEDSFYPRNPLDVLAQQLVAMAAVEVLDVEATYELVRRAAPFAELGRTAFEGVLDMLSGRYPSDEFAELRARVTWDRIGGTLKARQGARQIAVTSGGTIPDRGLYGVFLEGGAGERSVRVGELDEEMVFESRTGEVFLLGASSWRIESITHERVTVSPAPGEPGKMPFWRGDRPGRPVAFGRAIGELGRKLAAEPRERAVARLTGEHRLDRRAAQNLVDYLSDQAAATGEVPSDRAIVVERFVDEVGDYRVCVLSPFGARVHAPWSMVVAARLREKSGSEIESLWSDDGMVFRLPESSEPPPAEWFLPDSAEVDDVLTKSLGATALFAAHFRENAARALLLPRRRPGQRSPLWAQRKRSADLLAVASRYGSFPILLETYRECLRDVFDLPALVELLKDVAARRLRVVTVDSRTPSPFAASLLFSYVANFIYDGDAPLAERRAQALSIDHAQLRELLGEAELRELLDVDTIDAVERALQRLDTHPVRHADALHDLLLGLGDLSEAEIALRAEEPERVPEFVAELVRARRAIAVTIAGEKRLAAAEDASRLRDALGVVAPPGLPAAFGEAVADPLGDLVSRYARTHGPFQTESVAARLGLGTAPVLAALERLALKGRVLDGEFLPRGRSREWCDAEVLRTLKAKSLARLRTQVEPVEPAALTRLLCEWQGVLHPRAGADALVAVVQELEGAPLVASVLESELLPARIRGYRASDLDLLCAAGEVVWRGIEPLGPTDGRIAFFLPDRQRLLAPPPGRAAGELAARVRDLLEQRGALFFSDLAAHTGAFAGDLVQALWDLVWAGEVTNDTLAPLRSLLGSSVKKSERRSPRRPAPRRLGPPGSEGRWSLLARPGAGSREPTSTERATALASTLLDRYGVLTREAVHAEGIAGGFSSVYAVLKALEDQGKVRRGYFVAGLGATQFARPGAEDRLRAVRRASDEAEPVVLAATDPANPYGAALPWPEPSSGSVEVARPQRAAGALVVIQDGHLIGYLNRTERTLTTFLPEREPERGHAARALAGALAELVNSGRRRVMLIASVDGLDPGQSALGPALSGSGFTPGSRGYIRRPIVRAGTG